MITAWTMLLAVALDQWLGEPARHHPLVVFGRLAARIEARLYADRRVAGVLAWCAAVLPLVAVTWLLAHGLARALGAVSMVLDVVVLYLTIGLRSLRDHAMPVARALDQGDILAAQSAVGRMVSRDTHVLDQEQVAAAATESVLENGNDAVFGALFWFALLGASGAVLYRLANTLDAMWGYRNARYERFGWAAARIDDALNLIPARLTAATYLLLGNAAVAWRCWRTQARHWDSPNAGPVMAAGAGALGVQLGGAAPYEGVWESRPDLGEGDVADARTIRRAMRLVHRGVIAWLLVTMALGVVAWGARHA